MDKEIDFDSFLAQDMPDLDDACECCKCLLESMEYVDEWEGKRIEKRSKRGKKND